MKRVAVVGAGMMGAALTRGLVSAGWAPGEIVLADVRTEVLDALASELGCDTTTDPLEAAAGARGTILAVKPQDASSALDRIAGAFGEGGLMSIVAGLRTSVIEDQLGGVPRWYGRCRTRRCASGEG